MENEEESWATPTPLPYAFLVTYLIICLLNNRGYLILFATKTRQLVLLGPVKHKARVRAGEVLNIMTMFV